MTESEYIKYIQDHFTYHKDGTITRDDRMNSNGSYDKDGYLIIKIKTHQFKAHRVIWVLFNGEFPEGELDHINRIRDDNRIENLRKATRSLNCLNCTRPPNPDTGVVGVYYDRTKGLKAHYAFHYKGKTLRYRTLEEAVAKRSELFEHIHKVI